MEHHLKSIRKAAVTGRKIKLVCRNSYERQIYHKEAEKLGITHRSIIDYTQMNINRDLKKIEMSGCCSDCDEYQVAITGTPFSLVEINNGNDKKIVGNSKMIPPPIIYECYGTMIIYIDKHKHEFRSSHEQNVKAYAVSNYY